MRIFLLIVSATAAVAQAGCKSTEERRAAIELERDQQCRSYGAQPGTEIYVNCRLQLEQIAVAQTQAAAIQSANARATQQQIQNAFTRNRPVTCSTFGNTTTCN